MLTVERLYTRDARYHVGWGKGDNYRRCQWRPLRRRFNEKTYYTLRSRLAQYAMALGNAYRVRDTMGRIVLIVKRGHDGKLYMPESTTWS